MASTKLVREALAVVSDQLQDTSPQFERYTQDSLVAALNDAQRVLAKYLPSSCSRVDAIKLSPGTRQSIRQIADTDILPGDGSTPAVARGMRLISAPIRNMGANGATPGRAIRLVERIVLDQSDPTWHTSTARVVTQATYDPQTPKVFYVCPGVPATPDVWIEVPWVVEPAEISPAGTYTVGGGSATKLSVDDTFFDDIVNYVIARAYMKDAEVPGAMSLASAFTQSFVSSINAQAVAAGMPNPKLRALPTPQGN